jgi:hypothetical protein
VIWIGASWLGVTCKDQDALVGPGGSNFGNHSKDRWVAEHGAVPVFPCCGMSHASGGFGTIKLCSLLLLLRSLRYSTSIDRAQLRLTV